MLHTVVPWLVVFAFRFQLALCAGPEGQVSTSVERVSMSSGLTLYFSQSAAMENLKRWAQELDNPEYKLGYDVAVQREREVVAAIDSGQWPEDAYVEYQKLVASTGNVDSARLLVRYGLESILDNTLSQSTPAGKFHDSVKFCKGQ